MAANFYATAYTRLLKSKEDSGTFRNALYYTLNIFL